MRRVPRQALSATGRPTRGFTLLEALAAVVTLGLLAAAVVPLLRHLGRLTLPERMQAESYLRALAAPDGQAAGTAQAIAGHPGWSLRTSDLIAEAEPAPPPGCPPPAGPPHHWVLVGIHANDGGEMLAETLVVVLDPGAPP